MKKNIVIVILALLLLLSIIFNVISHNNSQKYKEGLDYALSNYVSKYKVGSISRILNCSLSEGEINYGRVGELNNYLRSDLNKLSNVHRELTMLYGHIFPNENYDDISSLSMNNLFWMLQDFYVYFEYLLDNNSDLLVEKDDGYQYILLKDLDEKTLSEVQIINEVISELDAIKSESYKDKLYSDHDAFKEFMMKSAEYYKTPDVQEKVQLLQNINHTLSTQYKNIWSKK